MTFEEIYTEFKAVAPATYERELGSKAMSVLPVLIDFSGNERVGVRFLSMFVLGAAMSDGKLEHNEYELLQPLFRVFFGDEVSFEESKTLVKNMAANGNLPNKVDEIVDFFGALDENLKKELVLICLMICAVDGDVSEVEKQWIARLVA